MKRYDVLIVGGGPAGCAAAACAKKHGLNACLIDRVRFPRDKTCGDLILVNALQVFTRCDLDMSDLYISAIRTKSFSFSDDFFNKLTVNFTVAPEQEVCQFKRLEFDMYLFEKISPYVDTLTGYLIVSIDKDDEGYIITFRNSSGDMETNRIHAKYIVGADGATSYIKREFFNDFNVEYGIATREYCDVSISKDDCNTYFFPAIENGGYFWVFPMNENQINCGIVLYTNKWKEKFHSIQSAHQFYKRQVLDMDVTGKIKTWSLPLNTTIQKCCVENVLLIGDAAGLIHPFIGHGIDSAILSGEIALKHIDSHNKNPNYDLAGLYSKEINDTIVGKNILFKSYRDTFMNVDEQFIPRLRNLYTS